MNKTSFFLSSIGQKLLLATSGLVMFLFFLVPHMGGNILFFFGPDIFNSYAHHLHQLVPILIAVEVVMLISLSIHMIMAFRTMIANKRAAKKRISQKPSKERSLAARLMPLSGIMIFVFIIVHLANFKFYEKEKTDLGDYQVYDVHGMVLERFQNDLWYVGVYILFMIAVGIHLSHALQSAMQTYGVYVPRKNSKIKLTSKLIAIVMASTFAVIPIYAFFYKL